MATNYKPQGFHSITPYFTVENAAAFSAFLTQAFDAKEHHVSIDPNGRVAHAQVQLYDSMLEYSEARAGFPPTKMALHLYVEDVDAVYEKAIAAGATSVMPPTNQFYGDRDAFVQDAFGNNWYIGTHLEEVSPEEMERRQQEM